MRSAKLIGLALQWLGAVWLGAQTAALTPRTISLDECLEMALKNNFDLRIERYNIEEFRLQLKESQTFYDPVFSFQSGRASLSKLSHRDKPFPENGLEVAEDYRIGDYLEYGLEGLGPMGFSYRVPVEFSRQFRPEKNWTETDWFGGGGTILHPYKEYRGSLGVEMSQPLLKGFLIDDLRRLVLVNRKYLKMSEFVYETLLMDVVTAVRLNYYELLFAREQVKVMEKALELSEKLLADNRAKVRAGVLPPLDEKQAESQVAVSKADLLRAQQQVLLRENALKNLIVKDLPEWKTVSVIPSEALLAVPQVLDVQESWRTGLVRRPDLAELRTDLERRDIEVKYRKNQTLPELNLVGSYKRDALGTGFEDVFWDSHDPSSRYGYYGVGVELKFPWGNRAAKYRLQRERESRAQAELRVQQLQQNIMVQIDDAISNAKISFDRIEATRQAREYAEAALQAEQKKLENGKSTSFFVLQFQRDLTEARSQEIRALTDYNNAMANLARAEGTAIERVKLKLQYK